MRPITTIPIVGLIIMTGLSFGINGNNSDVNQVSDDRGFALVELFTSEGCSSCPPADELAIQLSNEYPDNVYFLTYHVDYWNYLGWKDRFSSAAYTEKQKEYATAFNLNSIYTPQAVVNGKKEFVGSDQTRLRKTIMEEMKSKPVIDLSIGTKLTGNNILVSYKTLLSDKYMLNVALVQLHAETAVKKGENNGRYLKHINVVREFHTASLSQKAEGQLDLKIPEGLSESEIKVIAFIQDKSTLKVLGVADTQIK